MDQASKAAEVEVEDDVEEIEADEQGQGDTGSAAVEITTQLMKNPEVLAAIQDKLGSMVGTPSGYIQSLPKVVKRRLKSLKKLQFKMIEIESKFYEDVHALECKYAAQYTPLFDRRREVTNGSVEPTDSDCDWPSEEEDEEDELADDFQSKAKVEEVDETKEKQDKENSEKKEDENVTGVPEFWLTIFKNVEMLADMVQDHDEPILKHLQDIKVQFSQSDPVGFTLEFCFAANEYFSNSVLTKEYIMRSEADPADPFSYEGPEIIKCKGCTIDWNKGKNVTVKVIKKTQKHKGRGTKRTVTKTVQNDSFFNFFTPPEVPESEEADEETEALLAADFEIGHFIRERIVPRAVLYFTGEALDDDDDYDEEEGEEEENDDEDGDYDEDNDADFAPQAGGQQQPGECKQQ